jgi:ribosomal protein S18 acetylase RimI-like enzyme
LADHPNQLYACEFNEADQALLAGFSCGNEPWSRHVGEWIRSSDVLDSMQRGTRVWLFETAAREIVGFGSIGTSRWRWPPPDGASAQLVMIPMLGIAERFQGQPPDPEWRFADQVMSHLIGEARQLLDASSQSKTPLLKWLVLMVHRDNARAIRFYKSWNFELIPGVVRRYDHVVMQLWLGE